MIKSWSAALSLAGCLLLIAVLTAITPDPETDLRRSYADGSVGEWVSARDFDARVTTVETSQVIQPSDSYRDPVHSRATYLVTSIELRSRATSDMNITELVVHTADQKTYRARDDFTSARPPITPPGFTSTGQLVFELPDDRVRDARLVIGPPSNAFDWYDRAVRVDLGLAAPEPTGSTPIKLTEPSLLVTR